MKDRKPYILPLPSNESFFWFALDPYDKKIGAIEAALIAITNSADNNFLFRSIGFLRGGLNRLALEALQQRTNNSSEAMTCFFCLRMIINARLGLIADARRDWIMAIINWIMAIIKRDKGLMKSGKFKFGFLRSKNVQSSI